MLIDSYPDRFRNSPEFLACQSGFDTAADALQNDLDDFLAQLNVSTATWGLTLWEDMYGITPDLESSYGDRRSNIMSRMRQTGTMTPGMMALVAASYSGGEVEITEHFQQYRFTVKFVSSLGAPPRLEDFKAALEKIKPAHLAVDYEWSYLLIRDIHNKMTIAELEAQTLNKFAGG